jgi:hypothetical protein
VIEAAGMCLTVLETLMDAGIVALSIHDSFAVPTQHEAAYFLSGRGEEETEVAAGILELDHGLAVDEQRGAAGHPDRRGGHPPATLIGPWPPLVAGARGSSRRGNVRECRGRHRTAEVAVGAAEGPACSTIDTQPFVIISEGLALLDWLTHWRATARR